MHSATHHRGQSLIEILFAAAIFTIGVVTIGYLVLDASVSVRRNTESMQARLLAGEGIEAMRAIRDTDFSQVAPGTYGIIWDGTAWDLVDDATEIGMFTRTVTVESYDADTREVSVAVMGGEGVRERSTVFSTLISDWQRATEDAERLASDTSDAYLSETSDALLGVALQNTSSAPVVIEALRAEWTGEALLEGIVWNGTSIYSATTTPTASGVEIDIDDITITAFSEPLFFDRFDFTASIAGGDVVITLVCADGSEYRIVITV